MSACVHCAAMAEEVAELRRALGLASAARMQADLQRALALTPSQAKIVQSLYEAEGRLVQRWVLERVALGNNAYPDVLKQQVHHARKKLGQGTIETVRGLGYRMTQEGLSRVSAALG